MANFNIDYLVVAGGGGGGGGTHYQTNNNVGGGGAGAGGLLTSTGVSLTIGASYTVLIGDGGAGGPWANNSNSIAGTSGSNSSLTGTGVNALADGGGGGGSGRGTYSGGGLLGLPGGSGGGSGFGTTQGGTATSGQGNNGGFSTSNTVYGSGGGGGAGGAGVNGNNTPYVYGGGAGGAGIQNSITGISPNPYYAGGGGAGPLYEGAAGYYAAGGDGGSSIGGGGGKSTNNTSFSGVAGATNTGSGGGGGSRSSTPNTGGAGGSGIVILRYATADIAGYTATGLTPTEDTTTISGQTILSFTTVGTGTIIFTAPVIPLFSGTKVTNPVTGFESSVDIGLKLPSGTNSNQPGGVDARQGMIRNDTSETTGSSTSAIEHYNGTTWKYFAATESVDNPLFASQNFNTVLYNGNGGTQIIDSATVGFQPDLVWIKQRTGSNANHLLVDTVRGPWKVINTNTTSVTDRTSQDMTVTSFADGFTVKGTSAGLYECNGVNGGTYSGNGTYVSWCFKAGGLINESADFNGSSSYIYNAGLGLSGNTTISFWVKPEATQNQYANIIDFNHSSSGGFTIQQNSNNINQYSFAVNNSGTFNSTGYFSLTANVWSNVVITLDSSGNANVIVNNNSVATGIGLSGLSSNALSIGRWIGGSSRYFNGLIGQVRVFNQVLASSDITALYNETAADNSVLNYPQDAGCIAAYPLGENANDLSNTYNGTASNVTFGNLGYLTRNNDGDVESTVSANVAAGFSIVAFNSGTNSSYTVGTGLNAPPEMVISKVLTGGANWPVFHKDFTNPDQAYIYLASTAGVVNYGSSLWNYSNWGTNKIGATNVMFGSNNNVINYCFHSVPGYSKISSYIGNGNTTGVLQELGFEPAFLMFKCSSQIGNWIIIDNKRATSNPRTPHLRANTSGQDDYGANEYVNFTSTGFQPKGVSNYNNNSLNQTYIYMAFATS